MVKILRFDETKPYAFISYKSDDVDVVKEDVKIIQDKYGVNIWFDELLLHGKQWDTQVKPRLEAPNCKMVLFYASPKALTSTNVQEEIELVQDLIELVGLKWLPINFYPDQFSEVYKTQIHQNIELREKNKTNRYFSVEGARKLVKDYLSDRVNVIRRCSDTYIEDIMYNIKNQTPEIINKDIQTADKTSAHVPTTTKTKVDTSKESQPKTKVDDWRDVFSKYLTDTLKTKDDIHFCGNSTRSRISFNTTFMRTLFDDIAPRNWEKENNFNWQIRLDPNKVSFGPVFAGNQMRSDAERKKAEEIWLVTVDSNKKFKPSWQWLSKDMVSCKEADIDNFIKVIENDVDAGKDWVLGFAEGIMTHVKTFEEKLK